MNINNKKKVYTLINYPEKNKKYGKFTGKYPAQAAHKMLNFLAKKKNVKNSNDLNQILFYFIDKNSNQEFCYTGSRILLKKPTVIKRGNKYIEYKYKTIVRKCNITTNSNKNFI